jgi:hypothetical protein
MMATYSPDPSLGSYLNRDDQDTVTVTAREDPSGAGQQCRPRRTVYEIGTPRVFRSR